MTKDIKQPVHPPPRDSTKLLGEGKKLYHDNPNQQQRNNNTNTEERQTEGFPLSVFFIIGNEFCERFSYYGMKAILTLYLHNQLMYDEDASTVIYHAFAMLCYFTPILGAILADTMLGRYRTILYVSMVYVIGNAVLSLAALPLLFTDLSAKIGFSMFGLVLIAVGTGGIKPCVSAFGGDQFYLPRQELQLAYFFSMFYFSINAGSLLSTLVTPILRADVRCFDQDCYPLAFGVPAALMIVATVVFVCGSNQYIKKPPEGSSFLQVFTCITDAVRGACGRGKKNTHRESLVTPTADGGDSPLTPDLRRLLKVLVLFFPLPFFWALFDQQGSRWTFQATRMDGQLGAWDIKPDQMQIVNPLMILVLIPIFERWIYPCLTARGWLVRPLSRMLVGGLLAGVAFLISAFLELRLERTYPAEVAAGQARVTLINALPCQVTLQAPWITNDTQLSSLQQKVLDNVSVGERGTKVMNLTVVLSDPSSSCGSVLYTLPVYSFSLIHHLAYTVLITADTSIVKVVNIRPPDDYHKSSSGRPKLRVVYNIELSWLGRCVVLDGMAGTYTFCLTEQLQGLVAATTYQELQAGSYRVILPWEESTLGQNVTRDGSMRVARQGVTRAGWDATEAGHVGRAAGHVTVKAGAVYNLLIQKSLSNNANNSTVALYQVTPANLIHMLWLVPQYVVITVSEVMFSITGLQFSFTQAPSSMKSVVQAAWLITVSFGNLIVVVIAKAKFFDRQALEFILFAMLMFVDMIVFGVLAFRYKYVEDEEEAQDEPNINANGNSTPTNSEDTTNF